MTMNVQVTSLSQLCERISGDPSEEDRAEASVLKEVVSAGNVTLLTLLHPPVKKDSFFACILSEDLRFCMQIPLENSGSPKSEPRRNCPC